MTPPDVKAAAGSLLRSYSIETTPLDKSLPANLPAGTHVYIASVPRSRKEQIVERAVKLKKAGFVPVPHIVARGMENVSVLEDLLARLRGEADVDRALVLGGDTDKVQGPFSSSRAILETGLFAELGFKAVGFATYAEDHPAIPRKILDQELELKLSEAAGQGLRSWLVSQFCFEPGVLVAHVARLRSIDADVPVSMGIAGPATWASLARFAVLCGVKNSARFLSAQGSKVGRMLSNYDPSETVADLGRLTNERANLQPVGLHFFSFGGMQRTVDWASALQMESSVVAS